MPTILIAYDEPDAREQVAQFLVAYGYRVDAAKSPEEALAWLASRDCDAAILDASYAERTPLDGGAAEGLLAELVKRYPQLPVIVLRAATHPIPAESFLLQGARDVQTKPWDGARLRASLQTQLQLRDSLRLVRRLQVENQLLRSGLLHLDEPAQPASAACLASGWPAASALRDLVAESAAMQPVMRMIARVGPSDASVLISGEHGSGKGMVARALHQVSARAAMPMVTVHLGGLPQQLLDAELFGRLGDGALEGVAPIGSLELADGGTLFLDEIAGLPPNLQARLVRMLESGEVELAGSCKKRRLNLRMLSTTNGSLRGAMDTGDFRQDLLYRLNAVEIVVPPLRERKEDIPILASRLLAAQAAKYRKDIRGFSAGAMRVLLGHAWPGNVRELGHVVEAAVLMAPGSEIRQEDLRVYPHPDDSPRLDDISLEDMEKLLIQKALARFDGNVSKTAEALGLSRSALYRRLQRHNL
jgi:DNA-binding NtrC family response regulator